jgi:enamine deaminase RidA (YjgF/YER057c/UK114 family)
VAIEYRGSSVHPSEAVIHAGTVYLAAQVAADPAPPTALEQTRRILAQIDDALARCGTSKARLLTATLYSSDARYWDDINTLWDAWVPWHDPPACTYIVAKLATSKHRVAIQVTAGS